jgi:Ca2+-binding RTX toxin-like protein
MNRTAYALTALIVTLAWLGIPQQAAAQAVVHTCNGKPATIVGTGGEDVLRGTKLPDVIVGLGGNDTITGASGNDTICAGPGNDIISAGNGHDFVDGGSGNDTILGGFGNDFLRGGLGHDQVNGDTGLDNCDGGIGQDASLSCEVAANFGLTVKQVRVPVWNGSFTPGQGALAGLPQTALDGALFVPAGATKKIAVLATHGAFGGFDRGLVGWIGWWLEPYGITTLVLNRRDSTDYGPSEGGGNTLYPQSMCDLKSGVEYLVDTLGYEGVVILGHSKGTSMVPVYPGNFRLCGPDVAGSPAANDPRVAGVVTFGSIADNREASTVAPWAGPSFEEEQFPGLNCGPLLYDCNVAQADAELAAGRGDNYFEFIAGILTGNGSLLSVTIVLTPNSALTYYGPDTLGIPEREALKLVVPFLIVHADGDSVTPVSWSDRMYGTLLAAGKDVSYFKSPYQTIYPNGGPRDPNRGQPAHSLNAEGARWDFVESMYDWMVGRIPGAGEVATGVDMGTVAALPEFDPVLVPPAANPELP